MDLRNLLIAAWAAILRVMVAWAAMLRMRKAPQGKVRSQASSSSDIHTIPYNITVHITESANFHDVGTQLPLFELTETCLGQRSNRPGPSLKRKILSESSSQLSDEDDAERRLSDGTGRDYRNLVSKMWSESKSDSFELLYLI